MSSEVISVKIHDQEYKIKLGAQQPEYIKKLASYVDNKIKEFADMFPTIPYQKLLILVCLNISDEYFKKGTGEDTTELLNNIKQLLIE
ncbi:MAG TPA: cell division protein ZapA [Spirochaetota bacterium]|nr:cell division protein ZapA [Spirochaetota bacterium]